MTIFHGSEHLNVTHAVAVIGHVDIIEYFASLANIQIPRVRDFRISNCSGLSHPIATLAKLLMETLSRSVAVMWKRKRLFFIEAEAVNVN